MDIFEDEEWEKLFPVEVVVDIFKKTLKEASSEEAFRIEEALLELDTKLWDFIETWIEVDNYRKKLKDKYEALDLPDVAKITKMIDKFKGKHPKIALGWRRTKPRCRNFSFDIQ